MVVPDEGFPLLSGMVRIRGVIGGRPRLQPSIRR